MPPTLDEMQAEMGPTKPPEGEPEGAVSFGDCHVKWWRIDDTKITLVAFYKNEPLSRQDAVHESFSKRDNVEKVAKNSCAMHWLFADRAVKARIDSIHKALGIGPWGSALGI